MVVRIVEPESSQAAVSVTAQSGALDEENRKNSGGEDFSSWTDLGKQCIPNMHGVSNTEESQPENLFGDVHEHDLWADDGCDVSVSAEPSFGRSSQVGLDFTDKRDTSNIDAVDVSTPVDTQTALEVAARSLPVPVMEPIWEQGIWGVIFGDKSFMDVYKPFGESLKRPIDTSIAQGSVDVALPASSRVKTSVHAGISYHDVVRDKPNISWQEQRDADLQSSVKFWIGLVNRWEPSCSLVAATMELGGTDRIFLMFAHLFSGRSPVTVKKRAYSVMRLCDYLEKYDKLFPCTEKEFYDFLCAEQLGCAPQSRMKGYMQSMNFVQHVMAVEELSTLTASARCKGACLGDVLRERLQASPLKVVELRSIHDLLYTCEDVWVQMFCGALLMCIYCRARWGDLMRSESVILDHDSDDRLQFIEARTGRHKTMKSQLHRHQFLPLVAPCHGVDGKDWGSKWLQVRKSLGVVWPPEGLVMPAPGLQGEVTSRPLETQECAAWLRKIVGSQDGEPGRRISSHSLKSTFLSYAAKRGIGIPERLQLGYHTSNFQMGMVYSRDGAAASLLVLEKLIKEIETGYFRPDETRSGRIVETIECAKPAGEANVIHVKDESEVVEVSDSEDSVDADSSSSTSSEEERPKVVRNPPVFQPAAAPAGFNLWQHKKLKTLHLMLVENQRVFSCGRNAGALHQKLDVAPEFDTPLCSLCFSRTRE